MKVRPKLLLGAIVIAAGVAVTLQQLGSPERARAAFLGHLHHQRYGEAAAMLAAPSAVEQLPDGGLKVIAQDGTPRVVPAAKLPFRVGGAHSPEADQFSATALGPSTNGVLDTPAVVMRLRLDGDRVCIVSVDS
jgi:hypothetical protein